MLLAASRAEAVEEPRAWTIPAGAGSTPAYVPAGAIRGTMRRSMQTPTPWLSRTFTSGLPAGDAPALLSRLCGTPARARDLAASASDALLSRRPDSRRWSAKEHLAHLDDLSPLDETRLREYLAGAESLSAADMTNAATEAAEHNARPIADVLDALAARREAWVRELERLSDADLERTARHPRLQRELRLVDWLAFVATHDDHHLVRAGEALAIAQARTRAAAAADALAPEVVRAAFDLPAGLTYLNCASSAPQLRAVTAAGERAARLRATPWRLTAAEWFAHTETVRTLAAQVMGAGVDGVAIVPSVSYGIATAAKQARVTAGQTIVLLAQEFPSNYYAWQRLAGAAGAAIVTVQRDGGDSWTEAVLRHVDGRTAVVSVPQCHWTDGRLVDLARVGARAREVGALFVVDASQALGAYPIDVEALQPDFLVSVGYKWLLGPYGLAYLYAAPRWRADGAPLEESWLTRSSSEDFARLVDYDDRYRAGARRFDMGANAQFLAAPMAAAALTQVLAWGVAAIQARLRRRTDAIADRARDAGLDVCDPGDRVGHIVGLRRRGGFSADLATRLAAARVFVSRRGDAVRVAPHLFNDDADAARLFDVLA